MSKHHKKPRSRKGKDDSSNILFCPKNFHTAFHTVFGDLKPKEQELFLQMINEMSSVNWVDIKTLRNYIKTVKKPFQRSSNVDGLNISMGETCINFTMYREEKINGRVVKYYSMENSDLQELQGFRQILENFIKSQKKEVLVYVS